MESAKIKIQTSTLTTLEKYLPTLTKSQLYSLKTYYSDLYYNDEATIEDYKYDLLIETLTNKAGTTDIGCKLRDDEVSVKLPCFMGSLNKIKPDDCNQLQRWLEKNNTTKKYVITDKLDGVSGLLYIKDGEYKLYTRADGVTGKDISYVLKYINHIPRDITDDICVRGEFVINKTNYTTLNFTTNPRNIVSGAIKAKTLKSTLKYIDFVAYEYIDLNHQRQEPLTNQFLKLGVAGFKTVENIVVHGVKIKDLQKYLKTRYTEGEYNIDGIVVHTGVNYMRVIDKNPEYAFAFKQDIFTTTHVKDVLWNVTKSGFLKPRIELKPVQLCGAKITYATGYNALFIYENGIGPGAVVSITRSGEVIPRVMNVLEPVPPSLPDVEKFEWCENGIDIMSIDPGNDLAVKIINHFMTTIGAKHINEAIIKKLVEAGYDDILKVVGMKSEDYKTIPGFQQRLADKIYTNVYKALNPINLHVLMAASNCFGFGIGVKRLKCLVDNIPDIVDRKDMVKLYKDILVVETFSDKTATRIVNGLQDFKTFKRNIEPYITVEQQNNIPSDNSHPLYNKRIVCSGFRGGICEDIIKYGGIVTTSVSKNTMCVVVKDKDNTSGKIKKANELGIDVYTIEDFTKKYL